MGISDKSVVIATHYLVYGAPQALKDYLIKLPVKELLFIGHPLKIDETRSFREVLLYGKLQEKKDFPFRVSISIVNYIIEIILTFFWVVTRRKKYDLFVGVDNLNAFVGVLLRKMGVVKKVIFYTIDYVPVRFKNKQLNAIYHWLDKFCLTYADEVWNVSPRIVEGRERIKGLKKTKYTNQKVVPIGVWLKNIKPVPWQRVKKHQLLFVGHLLEKQGAQLVIRAIPEVVKKVPDFHFLVIGGGEYETALKRLVKKKKLAQYVTFTGWIKNRKQLEAAMRDSGLAIAMYKKEKNSFTYYADPTKLKDYLAMGLPILLTDVPYNAREIERKKCGVIVKYNKKNIAEAIIQMIKDKKKLLVYRQNALACAKAFDWGVIFSEALTHF